LESKSDEVKDREILVGGEPTYGPLTLVSLSLSLFSLLALPVSLPPPFLEEGKGMQFVEYLPHAYWNPFAVGGRRLRRVNIRSLVHADISL
jgi:hypothetical protein